MRPTNEEIEDLALRLEIDYREHRYQNCQRAASMLRRLVPPEVETHGSWPANDIRRSFVDGAKWWEWVSEDATMWPADVRRAEEEAEKRYTPSPRGTST